MEDFGAEGDVVGAAEDIEVEDPPLPSSLSFETFVVFAFTPEVIFFPTAPFAAPAPILPSGSTSYTTTPNVCVLVLDPEVLALNAGGLLPKVCSPPLASPPPVVVQQ